MDTTAFPALQLRVGRNIRQLRERRKWSIAQAAQAADIPEISWRKYESGERWPRPDQWQSVADALGVQPSSLLAPEKTS